MNHLLQEELTPDSSVPGPSSDTPSHQWVFYFARLASDSVVSKRSPSSRGGVFGIQSSVHLRLFLLSAAAASPPASTALVLFIAAAAAAAAAAPPRPSSNQRWRRESFPSLTSAPMLHKLERLAACFFFFFPATPASSASLTEGFCGFFFKSCLCWKRREPVIGNQRQG